MLIPIGRSLETIEIKKSRFISIAMGVSSADEARDILKSTRQDYPDSNHVVHAFLSGPNADIFGFSDDREPSGTAGRPVLEVLKGSGISNIIVLVIRYFGGTKLGTGGLVKAYTEAAQKAVKSVPVEKLITKISFTINLSYDLYDTIVKILKQYSSEIEESLYDIQIHISGNIPEKNLVSADEAIRDVSRGKVEICVNK
jgi:uncharacterized YigZ family protein